jgi:hypothetical protein
VTNEIVTNETVTNETATNENLTNETLDNVALINETLTNETLINESLAIVALTNEALTNETLANVALTNETSTSETSINDALTNKTPTNETLANDILTNETFTNETLTNEILTNETLTNEILTNETMINDTLTNETLDNVALTNETVTNENFGDAEDYADPNISGDESFLNKTEESASINTSEVLAPIAIEAPTNLQTNIASTTQITLTWIDASNNEVKFVVWRSPDEGANYTEIGTVSRNASDSAAVGGTVTFTDTGLAIDQTFIYYVTAEDAEGSSSDSNTAAIAFSRPAAPTSLSGTAVRSGSQYTITLNWTDNANNENGFQIQRSLAPTFNIVNSFSVGPNVTTFIDRNVPDYSRGYNYRVRSANPLGSSEWSEVVNVNTP